MDEERGESIDVDEDVGVMRMEEGQEPRQSLELNHTGTYDSVLVQLLRLLPKDFPSLTSTSFSLLKGLVKGQERHVPSVLRLVGKMKSTSSVGGFYICTSSPDISHLVFFKHISLTTWDWEESNSSKMARTFSLNIYNKFRLLYHKSCYLMSRSHDTGNPSLLGDVDFKSRRRYWSA